MRKHATRRTRRWALALREVVVIAVVVAVLLAMLLPYLYRQRNRQQRLLCESRQRETGLAIVRFESVHGKFPGYRNLQAVDADGERRPASWVFPVLPYLLYDEKQKRPGPYTDVQTEHGPEGSDRTRGQPPTVFLVELVCSANPMRDFKQQPNWMSFVVNSGLPDARPTETLPADWPANGVCLDLFTQPRPPDTRVSVAFLEEHDGAETTLLLSENVDAGKWTDNEESRVAFVWVAGTVDGQADPGDQLLRINRRRGEADGSLRFARPSSSHVGGVNVVFCSGKTQFLSEAIDYSVFVRLMTPDDANLKQPGSDEPIGPPYREAVPPAAR